MDELKNMELIEEYIQVIHNHCDLLYEMYEIDKKVIGDAFDISKFLEYILENKNRYKECENVDKLLVIYNGNPYITYLLIVSVIINNTKNLVLFPHTNFLAINHYLVNCFETLGMDTSIGLDTMNHYIHYLPHLNKFDRVIYIGNRKVYQEIKKDFNHNIIFIEE